MKNQKRYYRKRGGIFQAIHTECVKDNKEAYMKGAVTQKEMGMEIVILEVLGNVPENAKINHSCVVCGK